MKEKENGDVYDSYSWLEWAALIYFLSVFKLFFILRFCFLLYIIITKIIYILDDIPNTYFPITKERSPMILKKKLVFEPEYLIFIS